MYKHQHSTPQKTTLKENQLTWEAGNLAAFQAATADVAEPA